jgi:histidyl-tRNA synthetase
MNVKGTRDYLPEEMILRQQVLDTIRKVFETYGFQPLDTPALETWDMLSAKGTGGDELVNETYNFKDKGDRMIGLRYDLTVPLSRVIASNPSLSLPFKRYQMGNVWRYGDVTKYKFREFFQCDIDIVGSEGMMADAEIISCSISVLDSLGFDKFVIKINNRKILEDMFKYSGVEKEKFADVFRSIDKLDKIGIDGVKKELEGKDIGKVSITKILETMKIKGEPEEALDRIEKLFKSEGIDELRKIVGYLKKMKVKPKYAIDFSLARGQDYYTGPIFEIYAGEDVGSISGGGRYDKMIGMIGGKDMPATGIGIGVDRIIEVMKDRKMIEERKTNIKAFVIAVNEKISDKILEIVQMLRDNFIATDYDLRFRSLSKQMSYANTLGIPNVLIVGEKEIAEKSVKLRNMTSGEESMVKIDELVKTLVRSKK